MFRFVVGIGGRAADEYQAALGLHDSCTGCRSVGRAQNLPADRGLCCNTVAMMHYAKAVAHSALGDVPAAAAEQALFREAVKRVPKSRYLHNVPCMQLLAVAEEML
jgi:hypothetical protein